jgi:hypothetical protein
VIIGVSSMTSIEAINGNDIANVGRAFTDNADNNDLTNIAVTGVAQRVRLRALTESEDRDFAFRPRHSRGPFSLHPHASFRRARVLAIATVEGNARWWQPFALRESRKRDEW